ncbi:uncharacterized protein [Acropora muricata]|uniref:uncharacterized protein n=1 Tax=Acropora muricata TaxID=159855 RepID=UPI0034E51E1F
MVLRDAVKAVFLMDINDQCKKLCRKSDDSSSVLRGLPRPKHKVFIKLYSSSIIAWNVSHGRVLSLTEMKQHAPDVLDVLATIAVPEIKEHAAEQKIPPLCTAYGIFTNPRWKELSLIQKVNGILLGFGNTTERTMKRLKLMLVELPLQEMVTA